MVLLKSGWGFCMTNNDRAELTTSARAKIAAGGLMTLQEVAALLDVAESTVHSLPLPSIRLGRSLRFDPQDVCRLIEICREPVVEPGQAAAKFIYFGKRFSSDQTEGHFGAYTCLTTELGVELQAVQTALDRGERVEIRQPAAYEIVAMEQMLALYRSVGGPALLAQLKAQQA